MWFTGDWEPPIREPNEKDMIANFPYKDLTVIDGVPNYKKLTRARKEQAKNALSVKSIFGGGRQGTQGW